MKMKESKIETPNSKEAILKEQERIKNVNNQELRNFLHEKGIDAEKIPRIVWDDLLRIKKADYLLALKHNDYIKKFDEIIAPYTLPLPVSKCEIVGCDKNSVQMNTQLFSSGLYCKEHFVQIASSIKQEFPE